MIAVWMPIALYYFLAGIKFSIKLVKTTNAVVNQVSDSFFFLPAAWHSPT